MRPASGTIYVHIPFCAAKCLYCDFASLPERRPPEDRYVDALLRELDARLDEFTGPAPSIYFGGGTPSIFSGAAIARIVAGIRDRVDVAHDAEITLEANPGTVTAEKVDGYLAAGVNRVSMGVQSLRRPVLKALGRIHGEDEVRESVAILRAAGIDNFNLDFMYGLPERTGAMLEEDLAAFLDLAPAHLSAYCLTIYDETPFETLVADGRRREMDPDEAADEFERLRDVLAGAGFAQYEIANFAKDGRRSRHNEHYWLRGDYLGLGAGAVSFMGRATGAPFGRRTVNDKNPERYMARIAEAGRAEIESETLTRDEALGEAVFLGLRRLDGLRIAPLADEFALDFNGRFGAEIDRLAAAGLLVREDDVLRLSPAGVFLSDEVFSAFV